MAIEEHDREDLLREGRTMPRRGECEIDGTAVIAGFRAHGQLSLFCGVDPVFQFNKVKQLRRVFFSGRRFAAQNGALVELTRESRGGKVELEYRQLDEQTLAAILSGCYDWLDRIRNAASSAQTEWRVIGCSPDEFREQLHYWFETVSPTMQIAEAPNA